MFLACTIIYKWGRSVMLQQIERKHSDCRLCNRRVLMNYGNFNPSVLNQLAVVETCKRLNIFCTRIAYSGSAHINSIDVVYQIGYRYRRSCTTRVHLHDLWVISKTFPVPYALDHLAISNPVLKDTLRALGKHCMKYSCICNFVNISDYKYP